jgi:hypothetical protein
VQEAASHADPRTTIGYDRAGDRTPPTSSPVRSPELTSKRLANCRLALPAVEEGGTTCDRDGCWQQGLLDGG